MAGDRYEPNRFLGMPTSTDPHAKQGEEPQRVMGMPLDWFGSVNRDSLRSLAHPIERCRRWVRRRLDPYATDEDEPGR